MSGLKTNPCGADGVSAHSTGQEGVVKVRNMHGKVRQCQERHQGCPEQTK